MKHLLILTFLLIYTFAGFSQTAQYPQLIKTADSLFIAKAYVNAGLAYSAAFASNNGLGYLPDRYNAAKAYAMAGRPDSVFYHLNRLAVRAKYAEYDKLTTESAFEKLKSDPRWTSLLEQVKANQQQIQEAERKFDRPLIALLDSLVSQDQKWRGEIGKLYNSPSGLDTLQMRKLANRMMFTDSLNTGLIRKIVQKYGFPNTDLVGENGSHNFWLLIQHQDRLPNFQIQVLELMKKEVDAKKASASDYAYLVDRVKVNTGQLQVYGTQMQLNNQQTSYEPKPVIDPANLNKRRSEVGLMSIEEYTQIMNRGSQAVLKK